MTSFVMVGRQEYFGCFYNFGAHLSNIFCHNSNGHKTKFSPWKIQSDKLWNS